MRRSHPPRSSSNAFTTTSSEHTARPCSTGYLATTPALKAFSRLSQLPTPSMNCSSCCASGPAYWLKRTTCSRSRSCIGKSSDGPPADFASFLQHGIPSALHLDQIGISACRRRGEVGARHSAESFATRRWIVVSANYDFSSKVRPLTEESSRLPGSGKRLPPPARRWPWPGPAGRSVPAGRDRRHAPRSG